MATEERSSPNKEEEETISEQSDEDSTKKVDVKNHPDVRQFLRSSMYTVIEMVLLLLHAADNKLLLHVGQALHIYRCGMYRQTYSYILYRETTLRTRTHS